jgi:transposase
MDGVLEVITGRDRRRRWSTEEKLRIVTETQEPGIGVRAVAARHGICESLVFTWRRQVRDGVLVASDMPVFMPVQMLDCLGSTTTGQPRPEPRPTLASAPSPSVPMMMRHRPAGKLDLRARKDHRGHAHASHPDQRSDRRRHEGKS